MDHQKNELLVKKTISALLTVAPKDAELHLPLLSRLLTQKDLYPEALRHGVLGVLSSWLQFPNTTVRSTLLRLLMDFPVEQHLQQLRRTSLGSTIFSLSQSDSETAANRLISETLLSNWICALYHHNTQSPAQPPQQQRGKKVLSARDQLAKRFHTMHRKKPLQAIKIDTYGRRPGALYGC